MSPSPYDDLPGEKDARTEQDYLRLLDLHDREAEKADGTIRELKSRISGLNGPAEPVDPDEWAGDDAA